VRICFGLLIFLWSSLFFGQEERFVVYSDDEGLEEKLICDIDQDQNGNLLIAGQENIWKYNGYNFSEWLVKNSERAYFSTIKITNEANIWVGNSKGEIWLVTSDEKVEKIETPADFRSEIIEFHPMEKGLILAISKSSGVLLIHPSKDAILYAFNQPKLINCSVKMSDRQIILGATDQIISLEFFNGEINGHEEIPLQLSTKVNCLLKEGNAIWAGTSDKGLLKFSFENNALKLHDHKSELSHFNFSDLKQRGEILWMSSFSKGLATLKNDEINS